MLEIEHGTNIARERVSGTPGRSLHGKEALARLIEQICGAVGEWEDDVREARAFSPRRPRPQGPQIEHSTRFLLSNFSWTMQEHDPDASRAFGWEMGMLHNKALKVTHSADEPVKTQRCVGVRCPRCGWKALVWEVHNGESSGRVLCEHCERLLTKKEYSVQVKASMLHVRLS
jgi:DNA-directed RNA polymerase subunit RPC12/RpoP